MFALLLVAACGVRLPDPVLSSVSPGFGWNGEPTVVVLEGAGFYPQVEVDVGNGGEPDLDRGFTAWLDDGRNPVFPLSGLTALDYEHLQGVVEPGVPEGTYAVVLEGPTGRQARLEPAFLVSNTRADRLRLRSTNVIATVNSTVPIEVRLLDPSGERVQADLAVRLSIAGASGAEATFGIGLNGQRVTNGGRAVEGTLGLDGFALIPLTVHAPDTITLEIEPVDPESVIVGDTLLQVWQPGGDLQVEIELPTSPFETGAGEAFPVVLRLVDQFGNIVQGAPTNVLLRSACGDVNRPVVIDGEATVEVTATAATDFSNPCTSQYFEIDSGPPGRSEDFAVHAAGPQRFRVDAIFPTLRAGVDVLAVVTALDAFGNRTLTPQPITLDDSLGGLGPTTCTPSLSGDRNCVARTRIAGDNVVLTASSGAVVGQSAPYQVLPSSVLGAVTVVAPPQARAGEPVRLVLDAVDPFGNPMLEQDLPPGVVFTDAPGEICEVTPALGGGVELTCAFEVARPDAEVSVDFGGVLATSTPFEVINGDAASGVLTTPASVVAGQAFPVTIEVFDAFGNPYVDGSDSFSLADVASGGPVLLVDGFATTTARLEVAGVRTFRVVSQAQGTLGNSPPVVVSAGLATALRVSTEVPWAFVDELVPTRVEAVDAFGNRGEGTFSVTLTSDQGPSVVTALTNGVANTTYSWPVVVRGDVIQADGAGLTGSSSLIDIASTCADGPTALASFAGQAVGRVCVQGDQPVDTVLGLGGSPAGAGTLEYFVVEVDGRRQQQTSPTFVLDIAGVGRHPVDALIMDDRNCGSEVFTAVWAGEDDGSAVGALAVTGPSALLLGASGPLMVTNARDCTGDPAVGASLFIRTDRGSLTGASPSGEGLSLVLDGNGSAAAGLVADGRTGGVATVVVESASGSARGGVTLPIDGDDEAPRVWSQAPHGYTEGLVGTVTLVFSEALLPSTVVPAHVSLTGPTPTSLSLAQPSPTTMVVTLSPPVDPALGRFALRIDDEVRDLAGNRLDGGELGGPSAWVGEFGGLATSPDPVSCTFTTALLRPDGDPGMGEEADEVFIDLSTPNAPARWVLSVRDARGVLVQRQRPIAIGSVDRLAWNGRDVTGLVLPDGPYTLSVDADDGAGNTTGGCSGTVTLDRDHPR